MIGDRDEMCKINIFYSNNKPVLKVNSLVPNWRKIKSEKDKSPAQWVGS